jgi:hypothetical protein
MSSSQEERLWLYSLGDDGSGVEGKVDGQTL